MASSTEISNQVSGGEGGCSCCAGLGGHLAIDRVHQPARVARHIKSKSNHWKPSQLVVRDAAAPRLAPFSSVVLGFWGCRQCKGNEGKRRLRRWHALQHERGQQARTPIISRIARSYNIRASSGGTVGLERSNYIHTKQEALWVVSIRVSSRW